jgi:hypothetical protein
MKRGGPDRAGYSLVEMMIALLVSMVVMAALMGMVIHQQRFYLVANDISETLNDLQRVETVVVPELLPLSPGAGDILFAGDDSIAMRVFRGVYSVCDKLLAPDFAIVVRNITGNSIPLITDSVFIYSRGTQRGLSDDSWHSVKMSSVNSTTCPDGTPAWRAVIPGLNGVSFQIPVGSPVSSSCRAAYTAGLGGIDGATVPISEGRRGCCDNVRRDRADRPGRELAGQRARLAGRSPASCAASVVARHTQQLTG